MKALWGRKVSDLGFADFVKQLVYIAKKKGVKITFIDKWYPSSKTCSVCSVVNEALNLRDTENGSVRIVARCMTETATLRLTFFGLGRQPVKERT